MAIQDPNTVELINYAASDPISIKNVICASVAALLVACGLCSCGATVTIGSSGFMERINEGSAVTSADDVLRRKYNFREHGQDQDYPTLPE